jgi:CBS domain-containing protein
MNVQAILETKGHEVVTTRPETSIADVCRLLQRRRIGAVPVIDEAGRILGILSERDIVAGLSEHGAVVVGLTADALMSRQVRHCQPDDSIAEIMAVMTNRRVRHLPVIDEGRLCGVISIGDVVKARLDEAALEVDSLRQYVMEAR